jgi:hypothetical protein
MNNSGSKLEIRHTFDELAHSDLFRFVASGEVECDTGIPACKINPPVTLIRTENIVADILGANDNPLMWGGVA